MITESVEIARAPEEVFDYLVSLERLPEWQEALISTERLTEGPLRVGSRATEVRRVPGGPVRSTYEITAFDPPWSFSWRVLAGSVRPAGTVTVEPLDDGARSRVSIQLDLQGHGLVGMVAAPMAQRVAAPQLRQDYARLKQILESGG